MMIVYYESYSEYDLLTSYQYLHYLLSLLQEQVFLLLVLLVQVLEFLLQEPHSLLQVAVLLEINRPGGKYQLSHEVASLTSLSTR